MEEYEEIDDDFDVDTEESPFLDDDEIIVPEDEDIDEEYIYQQLEKRPSAKRRYVGNSLTNDIVANESGGDYTAINPNSSAVGKYQFLWNTWKDKINKVTGVKSKEEFRNNPQAQDEFYEHYLQTELMPSVERLRRKTNSGLTSNQLAKLVHFRGERGALDYLKGNISDRPESYNMSISKYIGKGQLGIVAGEQAGFPDMNIDLAGIYNTAKKTGNYIASKASNIIDLSEQFTSEQEQDKQYRLMLQKLYGDNPSNYAPVTQRVNNNPILY